MAEKMSLAESFGYKAGYVVGSIASSVATNFQHLRDSVPDFMSTFDKVSLSLQTAPVLAKSSAPTFTGTMA